MEYIPSIRYGDGIGKSVQMKFGGYDHNVGAGDGTIWDMENMCGDNFPTIETRRKRYTVAELTAPNAIFAHDDLYWCDGFNLYRNGELIYGLSLSSSDKTFASLGPYIVIMPDKVYYNTNDGTYGHIESMTGGAVSVRITDGTYAGETAKANTIEYTGSVSGFDWNMYFKVGDAVTIYGCTVHPENNKTPIIREISGKYLRFYENVFTINQGGDSETIALRREMPELDFMCENENRLWGCKGDTIYASKLGDIFNWNVFDGLATDSYAVDVGSAGDFTACVSYLGYPIFFKEDKIYKVYGSKPSNFQVMSSASLGVEKGSAYSLAIAGETLFYLSRAGIVAYNGGTPQNISYAFGEVRYKNAVGGSDGANYYVSMQNTAGEYSLFVYRTDTGQWYREDATQAVGFAWREDLYMLTASGDVVIYDNARTIPEDAEAEGKISSFVEFGDFIEGSPNKKGTSKLQIRFELEAGAKVTVFMRFDNDKQWLTVKTIRAPKKQSFYLPIIPRRSDHYRIRIEGEGDWRLYSLTRENYIGSEL